MRIAAFQPDIALNVGALARLCACFDSGLDVVEPCGFPFSLKLLKKSAMDYLEHVDIRRHTSWEAFLAHREPGRLVLLSTKAKSAHTMVAYDSTDTLVVGRESAGAPQYVHDAADLRVRIEMAPRARSLNVAIAAAIVLAEARRQTAGA